MATTDFKETGKIKFSDINDLQNNSLTTGNIYASGTSADIGTAENPFNKVYANYYYGTKFNCTKLFDGQAESIGTSYSLRDNWNNFVFLVFVLQYYTGGSGEILATNLTTIFLENQYAFAYNGYASVNIGINPNNMIIYFDSANSFKVKVINQVTWLHIMGWK